MVVGSWLLIYGYQSKVPTPQQWRDGVAYLEKHRASLDGLTWSPYWAEEGTPYFYGLNGFETPSIEHVDFAHYQVVWLFTSHGESLDKLPSSLKPNLRWSSGPLSLWRVENNGERVVSDLRTELAKVKVQKENGQFCDFWSGNGWHCVPKNREDKIRRCLAESTRSRLNRFRQRRDPHCGLSRWFHISQDVRVIDRFPRECVWYHPRDRQPFQLTWQPQPGGSELVMRYGFTDRVISMHSNRVPRTQPATIKISIGDRTETLTAAPVAGWFEVRYPIPEDASEPTIILSVSSENPVDGHLCLGLSTRSGGA